MAAKKNARRGECLGNKHHDGRAYIGDKCFAANENDTPLADEQAKAKARAWRVGKSRVWCWWVDRLEARLSSGGCYASMRSFTDDASQNRDFVDDSGAKVTVPHDKGLGRGIALLMVEEHPEFERLFRMRRSK